MSADDLTTSIEYRDIPGFPGYRVGSDGTVWSCWRHGVGNGIPGEWHELKAFSSGTVGYPAVVLKGRGKKARRTVHRLVIEIFKGPCRPGQECRHLDGNPLNNRVENLEWGTRVENMADRVGHGTHVQGEKVGSAKLTVADVAAIRVIFAAGGTTKQGLAESFGVTPKLIRDILARRIWRHV
jgi:hypothetical protein